MRICDKEGCENKHHAKGLCQSHYYRTPESRLRQKKYKKEYDSKPENKLYKKKFNKKYNAKPENKLRQKEYDSKPENKLYRKEYRDRPENKLRQKKYGKEYSKQHPEIGLKSHQKIFKKLSNELGIFPYNKIPMALYSWSKTVKKIHGNHCDVCGITKGIEAHHIFHKMKYPLLSLNENNGIPLCHLCHLQAHGKMLIV